MKVTIVTSMYKSRVFIKDFYNQLLLIIKKIGIDYQFVFVDDGCPECSYKLAEELATKDTKVKVLKLTRNFGHSAAMLAGINEADSEYVFTADIDLEDPPETLIDFYNIMLEDSSLQSVYGLMQKRQGGWFERISGKVFYACLNILSDVDIKNQTWSRLMTREYANAVLMYQEQHIFMTGIFSIVGFHQKAVPIIRNKTDISSYSLAKKIRLSLDAITSFSDSIMKFICILGFLISFCSMVFVGIILYKKYFSIIDVPGWATIVVSTWLLGGMILLSIGICGIYIGKIFMQSKNRPRYIIEKGNYEGRS